MSKMKWFYLIAMVIVAIVAACEVAQAQTPPVSTISDLPDTTYGIEITLVVTVESSISWATQQVGVYWTTDFMDGWNYAGATRDTLRWSAPGDNVVYRFASTVDDDEGNSEGYEFTPEASSFTCFTCPPPEGECTPLSEEPTLTVVGELASRGFEMEADEPSIRWWWTHSDTGTVAVMFRGEWEVDGVVGYLDIPAQADSTWSFTNVPFTIGSSQRLRVAGVDEQDRQGPFSLWSEPYTDEGPPGQPGTAHGTLDMK